MLGKCPSLVNSAIIISTRKLHNGIIRSAGATRVGSDPPVAPSQDDLKDLDLIRNIGIMAHIDAGKTTTTERMLYYSGVTRFVGEVHHGDTIMDYMSQERERGITITSAAITFSWAGHRVNLVDTPGHVDFTMEVERSLRVLDGALAILDASAGVEAQTVTVWRQADRYNVPRLVYLNKMDRPGASVDLCLTSVRHKLASTPLLLQLPLGTGKDFTGVLDLLQMKKIIWGHSKRDYGQQYKTSVVQKGEAEWDEAWEARNQLTETLGDLDDQVAEEVVAQETVEGLPADLLQSAIRRVTLAGTGVGVLLGSSYHNKGVQCVLDGVVQYLPSPLARPAPHPAPLYAPHLCALAFKSTHDTQRGGLLTFIRIYSGTLSKGQRVYNLSQQETERVGRVLIAFADEYKEVSSVGPGNIVVVTGLKGTNTGDTLVGSQSVATSVGQQLASKASQKNKGGTEQESHQDPALLVGVPIPDPVFFCSIEAGSASQQKALDTALSQLSQEDPSLHISLDPDTNQTILAGMGELHLEVSVERLRREWKVEAETGPLLVAYREAPTHAAPPTTHTLAKTIGESRQEVTITLSVEPGVDQTYTSVRMAYSKDNHENLSSLRRNHLSAVNRGVMSGLLGGPVLGYRVSDVRVSLHSLNVAPGTSDTFVTAATSQCLQKALVECGVELIEPYMSLEIVVDEEHAYAVLADLSRRHATILHNTQRHHTRVLSVECPLSELRGYSGEVRRLSSGTANFTMELSDYRRMSPQRQAQAVQAVTGFPPT
ncbi:hypothetical protein Pcinc_018969 [Petrolisthes cinctipes]|uniref:Tr-type G domain-containing protein n=1 Tax=Petrolisthes cinctipes TaxID=88211 RepID=A0AAE1KID2_PETCI|nr:hypothetical protein Pcinc_018969 [Petrolisthes cinctipes]